MVTEFRILINRTISTGYLLFVILAITTFREYFVKIKMLKKYLNKLSPLRKTNYMHKHSFYGFDCFINIER